MPQPSAVAAAVAGLNDAHRSGDMKRVARAARLIGELDPRLRAEANAVIRASQVVRLAE